MATHAMQQEEDRSIDDLQDMLKKIVKINDQPKVSDAEKHFTWETKCGSSLYANCSVCKNKVRAPSSIIEQYNINATDDDLKHPIVEYMFNDKEESYELMIGCYICAEYFKKNYKKAKKIYHKQRKQLKYKLLQNRYLSEWYRINNFCTYKKYAHYCGDPTCEDSDFCSLHKSIVEMCKRQKKEIKKDYSETFEPSNLSLSEWIMQQTKTMVKEEKIEKPTNELPKSKKETEFKKLEKKILKKLYYIKDRQYFNLIESKLKSQSIFDEINNKMDQKLTNFRSRIFQARDYIKSLTFDESNYETLNESEKKVDELAIEIKSLISEVNQIIETSGIEEGSSMDLSE